MSTSDTPVVPSREAQLAADSQVNFDIVVGIVLPFFCLWLDPIVFRSSSFGEPILGNYRIVGYLVIVIGILSLSAWLTLRKWPAVFAGLLTASAIHAMLLGVVLLPTSLIGMLFLIGVLGFSPFLTAYVFWRNGHQAYRMACSPQSQYPRTMAILCLLLAGLVPWTAQSYVNWRVAVAILRIESQDDTTFSRGVEFFRKIRMWVGEEAIMTAYQRTEDEERRQALSRGYREITGNDLAEELAIRFDD